MYKCTCKNVNGIIYSYVPQEIISNVTETVLSTRYNTAAKIPGTWVAHCLIPADTSHLKCLQRTEVRWLVFSILLL